MINYAEIRRLQRQIARLRGQVEENEGRIRSLRTEIARTGELLSAFSRRRAGLEQFLTQEHSRLLKIHTGSNLRISASYTAAFKGDYIGPCSRRLRTQDAFERVGTTIRAALDGYEGQIDSLKAESRSHENTIAVLQRQIYRLQQVI
jgi:peptidoglycan hydrolase CwlO-like protein